MPFPAGCFPKPNTTLQGGAFVGVLDGLSDGLLYLGSFRERLLSTFAGSIFAARRSSDDTEQDATTLANGLVNTTTLGAFLTGTNGYATTMRNQVGFWGDLSQSIASLQPNLYDGGGFVTIDGQPAMKGGLTTYLAPDDEQRGVLVANGPAYTGSTLSIFFRVKNGTFGSWGDAIALVYLALSKNANNAATYLGGMYVIKPPGSNTLDVNAYYTTLHVSIPLPTDAVVSIIFDGTNCTLSDGVNTSSAAWSQAFDFNKILTGTYVDDGSTNASPAAIIQQSFAIYTSDQTANAAAIRAALL